MTAEESWGSAGVRVGAEARHSAHVNALRALIEHVPFMVRLVGVDSRVLLTSQAWDGILRRDGPLEAHREADVRREGGDWLAVSVRTREGVDAPASWLKLKLQDGSTLDLVALQDREQKRWDTTALRRSEAKLRAIFEILPAGVALLDHERRIVEMNPALEAIARIPHDELLDPRRRLGRLVDAGGWPLDELQIPSIRAAQTRAAVRDVEVGVRQDDGDIRWLNVSAAPLPIEGLMSVVVVTSLDDRKRAEAALRSKEQELRLLTDSVPVLIGCYDREGRCELANRAYALTAPQTQVLGRSYQEVHPGEWGRLLRAGISRGLSGERLEFEAQLTADGRWVSAVVVPRPAGGAQAGGVYVLLTEVTKRRRMETTLRQTNERLQLLSRQLIDSQERDRRSIARELHDEIGQSLTAIKIDLETVLRRPLPPRLRRRVKDNIGTLGQLLSRVRDLSLNLRPSILDDLGLVAALRWQLGRAAERGGFRAELRERVRAGRLNQDVETACFRIAQEALTNTVRHAMAKSVRVLVETQAGSLELTVEDDGLGFDVGAGCPREGGSVGVPSMRERAALLGGVLSITSDSNGTQVRAVLPLRVDPRDDRE